MKKNKITISIIAFVGLIGLFFIIMGMIETTKENEVKRDYESKKDYIFHKHIVRQTKIIIQENEKQIAFFGGMLALTCVGVESADNKSHLKIANNTFFNKDYMYALKHPIKTARAYKKMKTIASNTKAILRNMHSYDETSALFLKHSRSAVALVNQSTWKDILNNGGNKEKLKRLIKLTEEAGNSIVNDLNTKLSQILHSPNFDEIEKEVIKKHLHDLEMLCAFIQIIEIEKAMRKLNKNFNYARAEGCLIRGEDFEKNLGLSITKYLLSENYDEDLNLIMKKHL